VVDDLDPAPLAVTLERIVEPAAARHVGLVAGIDVAGRVVVRGYGRAAPGSLPPGADTEVEIGSITKVLTGLLLAVLVEDGAVCLEQPVNDLLPPDARLPAAGPPVTLLELATHTSGLPRLPAGWFWRGLRQDRSDPYAGFGATDLDRAVRNARPGRRRGRISYSNFGMGLLGYALETHAREDYESLVRRLICAPLGLDHTWITPPSAVGDAIAVDRATGHDRRGRPVPGWQFPVLAAAGAFHSTVSDLLGLLTAQTEPDDGSALHRAIKLTHQRRASRGPLGQALGWVSLEHRPGDPKPTLWHNGGTGGFRSFCAIARDQQCRVVVVANDCRSVDRIGWDLVRALRDAR
jgi:serine-type D-Ala-D-Ala carboxypeptidase/endopeptidase